MMATIKWNVVVKKSIGGFIPVLTIDDQLFWLNSLMSYERTEDDAEGLAKSLRRSIRTLVKEAATARKDGGSRRCTSSISR
jgi:hypothetical protein